jgi:hypothetical protein
MAGGGTVAGVGGAPAPKSRAAAAPVTTGRSIETVFSPGRPSTSSGCGELGGTAADSGAGGVADGVDAVAWSSLVTRCQGGGVP